MDDFIDLDEDPYDFKSQFEKLKKESKNKALLKTDTKIIQDNTKIQESSNQDPTIPASTIISKVNSIINNSQPTTSTMCGNTQREIRKQTNNSSYNYVDGPIICIGDFDDGYNMPPPIQLNTETIIDDEINKQKKKDYEDQNTLAEINRIINVKVFWRKIRTHRFPIRMFQSIESIYEYFAKLESIDKSHVYLELKNISLSPSDTPNSINYKIVDFIDGDIVFYRSPYSDAPINEKLPEANGPSDDEIKFRILQNKVKHPVIMSIKKTDQMKILYVKLSEKLGLDVNSFTLFFDGDKIKISDTIESLDLEGDECIELFRNN